MLVNISEASRLTGKSRTTLYRAIDTGRLSVTASGTDGKLLETSELLRVYGEFKIPMRTVEHVQDVSAIHDGASDEIMRLRSENAVLMERNEQLINRLADKDKHLEDLRSSVRLLEHKEAKFSLSKLFRG